MYVDGSWYDGMASIGYNVTFESRRTYSVEVHLFDFKEEIYGEDVRVKWVKYLREEIKFNSSEELIEQLEQDELESKAVLANVDPKALR
jgi:riboflavin kinase/FMN adenylyltransferase